MGTWKNGLGDVYSTFRVLDGAVARSVFRDVDMRVLFVCTGNTCRSPLAEGYFRRLTRNAGISDAIEVASAGTSAMEGAPPSPQAVAAAESAGFDISSLRSAPLTPEEIERADLIVPMTVSHEAVVLSIAPGAAGKTRRLGEFADGGDIGDPFGGSLAVYQACFDGMRPALERLFDKVKSKEI